MFKLRQFIISFFIFLVLGEIALGQCELINPTNDNCHDWDASPGYALCLTFGHCQESETCAGQDKYIWAYISTDCNLYFLDSWTGAVSNGLYGELAGRDWLNNVGAVGYGYLTCDGGGNITVVIEDGECFSL